MDRKQKGLAWAALGFAILWVSFVLAVPPTSQATTPPGDRDVRVINTSAEPVPVTVRDPELGRTPFLRSTPVTIPVNFTNGAADVFIVPAGKRLVVESVSFRGFIASTSTGPYLNVLLADPNLGFIQVQVPLFKQATDGGTDIYIGATNPNLRLIPGTRIVLDFSRFGNAATATGLGTFSGYLLDAP